MDKTTHLSSIFNFFATPTPTAVWGSNIILCLLKISLITSKISLSLQLSEIKSFLILSKLNLSIVYILAKDPLNEIIQKIKKK